MQLEPEIGLYARGAVVAAVMVTSEGSGESSKNQRGRLNL
jgi:hypothetical protein